MAGGLNPGPGHAEVSGRLSLRFHGDNRRVHDTVYAEQQGAIDYRDRKQGWRAALAFALRQSDGSGDSGNILYQLFVEKEVPFSGLGRMAFGLGRMQRADGLGVYHLDGARMALHARGWDARAYAGKPGRIDDLRGIEGNSLAGIDVAAERPVPAIPGIDALYGRLGWQRYEDGEGDAQHRLDWALRGQRRRGTGTGGALSRLDVAMNGTWLPRDGAMESLHAVFDAGWHDDRLGFRLAHETYRPERPWITFREKFYSVYVRGRQTSLSGEIGYRPAETQWISLRRRRTDRETAGTGFGTTVGYRLDSPAGLRWRFQYDRLELAAKNAESWYLEAEAPLTPTARGRLGLAAQTQTKSLYGKNRARGLEVDLERMLRANLYLRLAATCIDNSRLADEYRLSLHLDYYFDHRPVRTFGGQGGGTDR